MKKEVKEVIFYRLQDEIHNQSFKHRSRPNTLTQALNEKTANKYGIIMPVAL